MPSPEPTSKSSSQPSKRSQGASKLPYGPGRGTSASPGKIGERYPGFRPSTGAQSSHRAPLSRIPTATTPKYSSAVPSPPPTSSSTQTPTGSRLAVIAAKSVESFRSPSCLRRQGLSPKASDYDISSNLLLEHSRESPSAAVGIDTGHRSEKPLPRPPSSARYSQGPAFISRTVNAAEDTPGRSMLGDLGVNGDWQNISSSNLSEQGTEKSGHEDVECLSTPRVKEGGILSATPNTIVHCGINKATAESPNPRSSVNTGTALNSNNPFGFQEPNTQAASSICHSLSRDSTMSRKSQSPAKDRSMDHNNANDSPAVTPTMVRAGLIPKPNPFRERLQSGSPSTAPQTPQYTNTGAFSYNFDEGIVDQSPTPACLGRRKPALPANPSSSKKNDMARTSTRTLKRKSKIPRISSPTFRQNGGNNNGSIENLPKSQASSPGATSGIPLPLRLRTNKSDEVEDTSPGINESKEAEDISSSSAESEVTDDIGEVEICEARAVTTTKIPKDKEEPATEEPEPNVADKVKLLPGGVKLRQLPISGRSDGPTLRIDPDADHLILGNADEEKGKKRPGRRSVTMKSFRRSTDSLLTNYLGSRRSKKPSVDDVAHLYQPETTQSQPRFHLPVKNAGIARELSVPVPRIDDPKKLSIRTVSGTPTKSTNPFLNTNGNGPSTDLNDSQKNCTEQGGSPYGGTKNGRPSTKPRETRTLNNGTNVNTPVKHGLNRPAGPSERGARGHTPNSGRRGQIPVLQSNYSSPRTPRTQPSQRMTFERMGFDNTNAPTAATPYAASKTPWAVRDETHYVPPRGNLASTARKSRIPSIPKTKSSARGVFQGFRGLFAKNKPGNSKETPSIVESDTDAPTNGIGELGNSPTLSHSRSRAFHTAGTDANPVLEPENNIRTHTLHAMVSETDLDDSPAMEDISSITKLTMDILGSARREQDLSKKEKLITMGQLLTSTVTSCHEAERGMLKAFQGLKDSEMACARTKENGLKLAQVIRKWTDEEFLI